MGKLSLPAIKNIIVLLHFSVFNPYDLLKAVYELVINGLDEDSIQAAMKAGVEAATAVAGISKITAGNYGGKLGKFQFHLKDLQ